MTEKPNETAKLMRELALSSMSAEDIVDGLRSENSDKRQEALDALADGGNDSLILLRASPFTVQVSTTRVCDAGRCFNGVLFVAQQLGAALGLRLGWVPEPDDPNKIIPARMQ